MVCAKIRESEHAQEKAGKRNFERADIQDLEDNDLKAIIINIFKELKEIMHKEVKYGDNITPNIEYQ